MENDLTPTRTSESTVPPPGPLVEVIQRMQKIRDDLDPNDGLACFNRMYLQVTELIGQNLVEGFFEDAAFIERLDVVFADLYFHGFEATQAGRMPDPSWKPLYDARSNRVVWPIQFAFAGMNAHINHDLPLATIATCKEFGKTPDATPIHADYQRVNELIAKVESEVRKSFETKLIHLATNDAETLKHIVGSWGIAAARDLAWNNTETLWTQRDTPFLYDKSVTTLAQTVGLTGRMLVTPVVPPPPD